MRQKPTQLIILPRNQKVLLSSANPPVSGLFACLRKHTEKKRTLFSNLLKLKSTPVRINFHLKPYSWNYWLSCFSRKPIRIKHLIVLELYYTKNQTNIIAYCYRIGDLMRATYLSEPSWTHTLAYRMSTMEGSSFMYSIPFTSRVKGFPSVMSLYG